MGAYSEVYGVVTAMTSSAADAIRTELAVRGYLDEETKTKWASEQGGITPATGHCIYFNGGTMKNTVYAVEDILELFADKIDKQRTLLRATKFDGDFALYEYNGKKMARLDDERLPDIVEGFSWDKWHASDETEDHIHFEAEADGWATEINASQIVEEEEEINQLKAWAESVGYRLEYEKNAKLENIYNAYSRLPHHDGNTCIKAHLYATPLEAVMAAAKWLHDSYKSARSTALPNLNEKPLETAVILKWRR